MTTVGYGDIVPVTKNERLFSMFITIIASGVFAFTLNSIGTIISRYNILAGQYKERMSFVNNFMLEANLPKDLRMNIRRYLEYVYETKKEIKIEEKEVFSMLNDNLSEKITVYLNGRILNSIRCFETFQLDFLSELCFNFRKQTFIIDENIFIEG